LILKRKEKNGTVSIFNYDIYYQRNPIKKFEYTLDDLSHPVYSRIRQKYYNSKWHKLDTFIYDNKLCKVTKIAIVYDTGFVLRLDYTYTLNNKIYKAYRYIENLNSIKFLRLLKFSDIKIVTFKSMSI
jgi:hypothetical protein